MSYFNPTGDTLVARQGYGATGGILDTIGGFVKSGAKAALEVYGSQKTSEGQAAAAKEIAIANAQGRSSMPSWALPAAIGAVGLLALVVISKRRAK